MKPDNFTIQNIRSSNMKLVTLLWLKPARTVQALYLVSPSRPSH